MILAGDVGGTKTALALFDEEGGELRRTREATFQSREHVTAESILREFLRPQGERKLEAICLGVAGPVIDGRCQTTNLPWTLEEDALSSLFGTRVKLLNDLEATAYGALHLGPQDVVELHPGAPSTRTGNVAVIAAGTGLGEAFMYWDGQRHHPVACEGGHADFAPRTAEEFALLEYLRDRYGRHVSYERVISGPGLHDIYLFLRHRSGVPEPASLACRLASSDRSAVIAEAGLAGADPVCSEALKLYCSLYGAEAGNLALKCMAVGGVFVGGGIAPKILAALRSGSFLSAYWDKGRFEAFMRRIPVRVILNPESALLGAAHFASRL